MDRRELLKALGLFGTALLPAAPALARALEKAPAWAARAAGTVQLRRPQGHGAALRRAPWRDPAKTLPKAIRDLTWDQYQAIRYRPDHALWADREDADFRFQFFHLGLHFETPVKIHEIVDGEARPIPYRTDLFDFSDSGVDPADLPEGWASPASGCSTTATGSGTWPPSWAPVTSAPPAPPGSSACPPGAWR